jgi:Icc protein
VTTPTWRFVHVSDTHICPDPAYHPAWAQDAPHPLVGARSLVRRLQALPFTPDFILHTGDLVYDPDPAAYDAARGLLAPLVPPIHVVAGNHDDPAMLQHIFMGTPRSAIRLPFYYETDINGLQLLCLDSTQGSQHTTAIDDAQLAWLAARCTDPTDDRPLVVALHHNTVPVGVPWLDDNMSVRNSHDLHRILRAAGNRLRGVFFGHIHQSIDVLQDGILYSTAPSTWYQLHAYPHTAQDEQDDHALPGFAVVTITPHQTFIRRYMFPLAVSTPIYNV